jgi:hypothetical protein
MNTQNLPAQFYVRNNFQENEEVRTSEEQFAQWRRFIGVINSLSTNSQFSGDSFETYYGRFIAEPGASSFFDCATEYQIRNYPNAVELSLVTFFEIIDAPSNQEEEEDEEEDENIVETYDGDRAPRHECRMLMDDSEYAGEWARITEITYCDYGDGYALDDEVSCDVNNNSFVTDCAHMYNLEYSEYNDAYICTDDDYAYYGVFHRNGSEGWFISEEYVQAVTGDYYADSCVANANGYYYDDQSGEYVHEDDMPADVSHNNGTYHHMSRPVRWGSEPPKFSVGFEVEKEDDDAGMINHSDLWDDTGWCKESDASLNKSGYELVSPAFDLYSGLLEKEISSSNDLQRLINGRHSKRCGGHIHVASSMYTPVELFEGLSGFFPLLYAMFPHRINEGYCRAKKKHEYYEREKRSAVYLRTDTVEFRIFSAVKNVNNLIWRRDLMRIMCNNINKSELDVLKMIINPNSILHKHLRKVYSHDALMERAIRFVDHCKQYNNKNLKKPDVDKVRRVEALGVNSDDLAC